MLTVTEWLLKVKNNLNFKKQAKKKLSLFADDMILYIENPEDAARKLLEFINKFHEYAEYKIHTQKSLVYLYTKKYESGSVINGWLCIDSYQ